MDHAIYTAMGAASQTMQQQAVTASNLANTSTPGFRAQLTAMRAVPVVGPSVETRTLVAATTPGADMTPGQLDYTARPLDVAVQQDGWLAVRAADGTEGYTRNGNILVSATGHLTIQGMELQNAIMLYGLLTSCSTSISTTTRRFVPLSASHSLRRITCGC